MPGAVIALTTILCFGFGLFVLFGIQAAVTPLLSMAILVDIASVVAMADMLKAGTFFVYILSAVVFLSALYKCEDKKAKIKEYFSTPGILLFIISSAILVVILLSTQPVFHDWDEFSFWGISKLLTDNHNRLYTYFKSSMVGSSTPPALAVLSYFFGFFNAAFTEWVSYFAYDVLFMACFAAFTGISDKKQPHISTMLFVTAVVLPFIFTVTELNSKLSSAYISVYADMPMGFVFAGAIAVYLCSQKDNRQDILQVLPVIVFLTYIKDMGFALSCITAFVLFFDMVVSKKQYSFFVFKGFAAKVAAGVATVFTALATFLSWSFHMARVMQRDPFNLGGETNMGMIQMLLTGVKELLSPEKSRKFTTIMNSMFAAFFDIKISMLGAGIRIVAVITVIFALAFIFGDKKGKIRTAVMYITTAVGFVGYYIFHIFLYVYIFKDNAYVLPSYERYMYIYYIGWFAIALLALTLAATSGKAMPVMFVYAIGAACLFITGFYLEPGNTFICAAGNSFPKRRLINQKVERLQDVISPDDVIYVISENNAGENWFIYTHELPDNYFVKDYRKFSADSRPEEDREIAQGMLRYMEEKGVTHVIVDEINHIVGRRYDHMFDVSIDEIAYHRVAYYKVNYTDTGFDFTLVKRGRAND